MVQSKAKTVQDYLDSLPDDRREVVSAVRDVVLSNLPSGYQEVMNWGMISYEIPLERYPKTYNGQPLSYICLAAQKNHCALYLMCVYGDEKTKAWLQDEFTRAGKKLNMGKSCLRFRKLADLPLEVLGKVVATVTPEKYIERYEALQKKSGASR